MDKVILIHPDSKAEFEYEEGHAQRIMQRNPRWTIKKTKRRKNKSDGVESATDQGNTEKATASQSDNDCGCS